MKAFQKQGKSPYNPPPANFNKSPPLNGLKAQIIKSKLPQSSSQSSSQSDSQSYDSEIQQFANQFYDQDVQKADAHLQSEQKNNHALQNSNIPIIDSSKITQQQQNQKSKLKTKSIDKISQRLKQLKNNLGDLDMEKLLFKKKDESKLKQIAEFLKKKHIQKKKFMKRLQKIKNSQKQKRKIQQEIKKHKEAQQHKNRIKQIRSLSLLIKQKIQKKKQEQEQKIQEIEKFYQNFHKKYKKEKLYKILEIKDKKKKNEQMLKQKDYLNQRKKFYSQIVSLQDINQFKKKNQSILKDLDKIKQVQKHQRSLQIYEKNRDLKNKIYISKRYLEVQDEEQKKKMIRAIPKQKLQKVKKFQSYIRQNFMPQKIQDEDEQMSNKESDEEEKIIDVNGKKYKRVKKDRYLNGQRVGQKIQTVPIPKTQKQMRMQGIHYLQQLKLLPKKRRSTSLDLSKVNEVQPHKKPMTSRIQIPKIQKKRARIKLSNNPNRHQIQNLIGSLKAKDKLIERKHHYLKVHNNSGQSSNPQKQLLDEDLLFNIEKKIDLLAKL